jgi:hypothetical protein
MMAVQRGRIRDRSGPDCYGAKGLHFAHWVYWIYWVCGCIEKLPVDSQELIVDQQATGTLGGKFENQTGLSAILFDQSFFSTPN